MKAIVIPGSRLSVNDDEVNPWIKELQEFIRMVYAEFPKVKMLGICFGH
jgi:GMP synthase-like glutamine amidotransferase